MEKVGHLLGVDHVLGGLDDLLEMALPGLGAERPLVDPDDSRTGARGEPFEASAALVRR